MADLGRSQPRAHGHGERVQRRGRTAALGDDAGFDVFLAEFGVVPNRSTGNRMLLARVFAGGLQ
jgi:hypothetical protein